MKKAFYASAFIFETLKVFGEVSDEVHHNVCVCIVVHVYALCVCIRDGWYLRILTIIIVT